MADLDRDPYEVLGVVPSASPAEVTSAYRRRVRDLHPDSGEGATADPTGLTEVIAAFGVLRDPEQRAAYDAGRPRRQGGQPSAAGLRIPVRRMDAGTPSATSEWLRAGPPRFDPEPPPGSWSVRPPAARFGPSADLYRLIDELLRHWG